MVRRIVLAALAAVALGTGLLWLVVRDPLPAAPDAGDSAAVGVRYGYDLHTHCGVDFIEFDGRWWEAQPHLDDGNGNPPDGWDNGYQGGTLTLLSETELRFEASGGRELAFVPVAPRTPEMCG